MMFTERKNSAGRRRAIMRLFPAMLLASVLFNPGAHGADFSLHLRLGYAPHAGGIMHSGWQRDNLAVRDGLNDINRSSDNFAVSTIEAPLGVVAALETMFTGDIFYFKTGIWSLYTITGGSGKTVDAADTELVNVACSQWSVDVPATFGVNLFYWGESRIFLGCGLAFAYGMSTMSFKSATLDHSAAFAGYAIPLVAELGCEYMTGSVTSVGCGVRYLYGRSSVLENGSDYSVVDFTGFTFTASASVHFGAGGL